MADKPPYTGRDLEMFSAGYTTALRDIRLMHDILRNDERLMKWIFAQIKTHEDLSVTAGRTVESNEGDEAT